MSASDLFGINSQAPPRGHDESHLAPPGHAWKTQGLHHAPPVAPAGTGSWRPRSAPVSVQQHDPTAEERPTGRSPNSRSAAPAAPAAPPSPRDSPQPDESALRMWRQPETKPISADQLVAEVKGIYAGLLMVEAKCCEVDQQFLAPPESGGPLRDAQWNALIALHRTLLHEHYDFILASQYPFASLSLKRLALKYAMPARMWKHGIHSLLELLRHRLPDSLEHMRTFICLAYSMMTLLYETVPVFENIWMECLGDLGRYWMAIEDGNTEDREAWRNVARDWYCKAANKTPHVGRLYHHLGVLAGSDLLQRLFYYCKSLGMSQPFNPSWRSILAAFDPINADALAKQGQHVEASFVHLHSIAFTHVEFERFSAALDECLHLLVKDSSSPVWQVQGFYMAVCNIMALYQYGAHDGLLGKAWREGRQTIPIGEEMELSPVPTASDQHPPLYGPSQKEITLLGGQTEDPGSESPSTQPTQEIPFSVTKQLAFDILSLSLDKIDDNNMLLHWHAWMVFLSHIIGSTPAARLIENDFPWIALVEMLNRLSWMSAKNVNAGFPSAIGHPLPEDYDLRGFDWSGDYFPPNFFEGASFDSEEEDPSIIQRERILLLAAKMSIIRRERILSLAAKICGDGDWLAYSPGMEFGRFAVHPALGQRIEASKTTAAMATFHKDQSRTTVPSDVDMATLCGYLDDDDYCVVDLPDSGGKSAPITTTETIAEGNRSAVVKGSKALHPEYTVYVVDKTILLFQLETFILITSNSWPIVVPNAVIAELHRLAKDAGSEGDLARSALIALNRDINERKDLKIITVKGSDLTKIGLFSEECGGREDEDQMNIDDIVIQTAKVVAGSRREMAVDMNKAVPQEAEPTVLLTEDVNMCMKANASGVPAISTTAFKSYLLMGLNGQ